MTRIDEACNYARLKMRVFPVRWNPGGDGHKAPMPGYAWRVSASSKINEVVEDFDRATQLWGDDNVMIAWALGEDGYMAVDLDTGEEPSWVQAFDWAAAENKTAKGRHLVTLFPEAFEPGNGANNFPTKGWGEVRGRGGYIIIAGPDRPGFDATKLQGCKPFPRPEWLQPYGGPVDAVSRQEVVDFATRYNESSNPNFIHGLETACAEFEATWESSGRPSRHMFAVWAVTCAAEDAIRGQYAFRDGLAVVKAMWQRIKPEARPREWDDILAWSVGKALANLSPPTVDDPVESEPHESSLLDEVITVDESFLPVDLTGVMRGTIIPPSPSVLKRDDRQALFYRGQVNSIHADSGIGKGWVALMAAAQALRAGSTVMMLDLEDVPASIIARLRQLGARDDEITDRFIYIRPAAEFTRLAIEHLVQIVTEREPALVIIDSLGEAFGLEGIDENHDSEVGPWLRAVPRRLADVRYGTQEGPAVLIVDHVTKLNDNPLHPSGSKRKRAAVGGATYWVQAPDPLSADTGGRLRLVCAKDRHGTYKRGEHVADLVMRRELTGDWRVDLYSPLPTDDSARAKVATAINKAVSVLAELGKPTTQNSLAMAMEGRKETAIQAIRVAIDEGAIIATEGTKGARILSLPSWISES